MQLKEYRKIFRRELKKHYPNREINNILRAVVEDLVKIPLCDDLLLTPIQIAQLKAALDRLQRGEPVQYITSVAHFYGYRFKVNTEVLIPRPETEGLTQLCISELEKIHRYESTGVLRILDIGTGSGCIAIVLKKKNPALNIWAVDKSDGAIALAKENALKNRVSIHFCVLDIFNSEAVALLPVFNLLISNPPYIPVSDKTSMESLVVDHEPASALFVPDEDPLQFYKQIIQVAKSHLIAGGQIVLEINDKYASRLIALFKRSGFQEIEISKDLQGRDRYLLAVK